MTEEQEDQLLQKINDRLVELNKIKRHMTIEDLKEVYALVASLNDILDKIEKRKNA